MNNTMTWVLVADEAIARILVRSTTDGLLEPVEELTDPNAHARNADLRHDAQGRRSAGTAGGPASSFAHGAANVTSSAGEGEQHLEAEKFAKQIAERLFVAWQQKRFGELHVVAAPRLLGLLRKSMSAQVTATVRRELSKDLIHMSNRDITDRLFGSDAAT